VSLALTSDIVSSRESTETPYYPADEDSKNAPRCREVGEEWFGRRVREKVDGRREVDGGAIVAGE
jgi:hypothetical protein